MYEVGQGVPQNYSEAFTWYLNAAEQNFTKAQKKVAVLYIKGSGVKQDYIKAYLWFSLAERNGDINVKKELVYVSKRMSQVQINQAEMLINDWRPKDNKRTYSTD